MIVDLLEGVVSDCNKICRVVFAHTNGVMDALQDTVLAKVYLRWLRLCREGSGEERERGNGMRCYKQKNIYSNTPDSTMYKSAVLVSSTNTALLYMPNHYDAQQIKHIFNASICGEVVVVVQPLTIMACSQYTFTLRICLDSIRSFSKLTNPCTCESLPS